MYLGNGNIDQHAICFLLKVSLRVRSGAPKVRSFRKVRVNLYRRTPLHTLTYGVDSRTRASSSAPDPRFTNRLHCLRCLQQALVWPIPQEDDLFQQESIDVDPTLTRSYSPTSSSSTFDAPESVVEHHHLRSTLRSPPSSVTIYVPRSGARRRT